MRARVGHSKAAKSSSHDRILEVAARRFRERGFDGVGLAELMAEAGLTLGGFYRHFPSRDALIGEATERAFANVDRQVAAAIPDGSPERFARFLDCYLTMSHRDEP